MHVTKTKKIIKDGVYEGTSELSRPFKDYFTNVEEKKINKIFEELIKDFKLYTKRCVAFNCNYNNEFDLKRKKYLKQNNNYDIGFTWNGTEYQLVADLQFWQQPWSVELFLDKITQRYAYNSILKATEIQGFQRIEEVTQENGSIKLTLQRWK